MEVVVKAPSGWITPTKLLRYNKPRIVDFPFVPAKLHFPPRLWSTSGVNFPPLRATPRDLTEGLRLNQQPGPARHESLKLIVASQCLRWHHLGLRRPVAA